MGLWCLSGPKVHKSKLGLSRVTMEFDKFLNQSPQGGLENIDYTSSKGPPRNCCKVPNKYLIGHMLGGQNGGSTKMLSSVEITSVKNVSKNTNNEWNEVNYTEELKEKDQRFYLST